MPYIRRSSTRPCAGLCLFRLFYETVDYAAAEREHLERAREAHARGELLLAGALADPLDRALLVFRAPDTARS